MNNNVFSKMNIETLMPSKNNNYNHSRKLDVNTISSGKQINLDPSRDFNSNDLLTGIYERRKKIRNWLVDMYNLCCTRIKDADENGFTDLVFELPELLMDSSLFKEKECIEYISKNLREQNIDTLLLKNNKLFITWKYIELNKEKIFNI
jgi:hypothetical protein